MYKHMRRAITSRIRHINGEAHPFRALSKIPKNRIICKSLIDKHLGQMGLALAFDSEPESGRDAQTQPVLYFSARVGELVNKVK